MEYLSELLILYYTKIKQDHIELHKEIDDRDIIITHQFKMIYICDKQDIIYMSSRRQYISFFQTPKTEYYEKYLRLDNWNYENGVYPYIQDKTIEEMKTEECEEIKNKNKFLRGYNIISPRNLSFIIRLEKIDTKYYLCYYMKNSILEGNNIINNKNQYILKEILSDIEKNKILEEKSEELNYLMTTEYNNESREIFQSNYQLNILKNHINLYKYQEKDINWMNYIESRIKKDENYLKIDYSDIQNVLNDKYVLTKDTLLPSYIINQDIKNKYNLKFYGGNLISEVGLGKTIISLYHIFNNKEFIEKRQELNKFLEFSQNCNYFYKRGSKKGEPCNKICENESLFCKEHINTLFVDKRNIIYKNLHNFDPNIFLSDSSNKINLNSTLIICPNHLCDQWVREYYDKFTNDKRVLLLITKDQFNNLTLGDLLFSDLVITSYNILTTSWYTNLLISNNKKSVEKDFKLNENLPLEKTEIIKLFLEKKHFNEFSFFNWKRIILDEAHEISKMNKNSVITDIIINKLSSDFKWNITGTPFSNGLHGFLNLMKYNTSFKNSCNFSNLYEILNCKLKSNIITVSSLLFKRNTKKSVDTEVKKNIINQYLKLLNFTEEERSIYSSYENGNKKKFSEFLIKLCCHCELNENHKFEIKTCKSLAEIKNELLKYNEDELKSLENEKNELQEKVKKSLERLINLSSIELDIEKTNIANYKRQITNLNKSIEIINRTYIFLKNSIESSEDETCTICLDLINKKNTTITKCGHKFCWECISSLHQINQNRNIKCPNCNTELTKDDLYYYSEDIQIEKNENIELKDIIQEVKSTKIGNIIYFLKELLNENIQKGEIKNKIIIFSQWDLLLDKVSNILSKYNLNTIHCKGTVYQKKRYIKQFVSDPNFNIIMLSSKNAASGINLTEANKIILLEPIYGKKEYRTNIENQAIGRSDRIGQKKHIDIYRFIIKDTLEEDIINNNIKDDELPHINL